MPWEDCTFLADGQAKKPEARAGELKQIAVSVAIKSAPERDLSALQ
jgi:hypothetical protein